MFKNWQISTTKERQIFWPPCTLYTLQILAFLLQVWQVLLHEGQLWHVRLWVWVLKLTILQIFLYKYQKATSKYPRSDRIVDAILQNFFISQGKKFFSDSPEKENLSQELNKVRKKVYETPAVENRKAIWDQQKFGHSNLLKTFMTTIFVKCKAKYHWHTTTRIRIVKKFI